MQQLFNEFQRYKKVKNTHDLHEMTFNDFLYIESMCINEQGEDKKQSWWGRWGGTIKDAGITAGLSLINPALGIGYGGYKVGQWLGKKNQAARDAQGQPVDPNADPNAAATGGQQPTGKPTAAKPVRAAPPPQNGDPNSGGQPTPQGDPNAAGQPAMARGTPEAGGGIEELQQQITSQQEYIMKQHKFSQQQQQAIGNALKALQMAMKAYGN